MSDKLSDERIRLIISDRDNQGDVHIALNQLMREGRKDEQITIDLLDVFDELVVEQAKAWVKANTGLIEGLGDWMDRTPFGGMSCEGCSNAEYDEGGWYGCGLDFPTLDQRHAHDLFDAISEEIDDRTVTLNVLARTCPKYADLQEDVDREMRALEAEWAEDARREEMYGSEDEMRLKVFSD